MHSTDLQDPGGGQRSAQFQDSGAEYIQRILNIQGRETLRRSVKFRAWYLFSADLQDSGAGNIFNRSQQHFGRTFFLGGKTRT